MTGEEAFIHHVDKPQDAAEQARLIEQDAQQAEQIRLLRGEGKRRPADRHTGPRARTVRGIDDQLWQAAKDKAAAQGSSLSRVILALLTRWVSPDEALAAPQPILGQPPAGAPGGAQRAAEGGGDAPRLLGVWSVMLPPRTAPDEKDDTR